MVQTAELDVTPDTIEATLNYIVDDGTKVFTITAGPGGQDVRSGGTPDPRRMVMHNGRPQAKDFVLERDGFRFVRHDTKVADFYDENEIRRVYYPEMEALIKAESGATRVVVFDHTLRTADDDLREVEKNSRGRAPRPQRLYRMVGAAARARFAAGRSGRAAQAPLRHHPGVAADPASGRDLPARDLRRAHAVAGQPGDFGAALSRAASARPTPSPTIRRSSGTGFRACGATRRWCSRSTIYSRTAAPAGPRTPRSTTPPRRRMHGRARASKSARWRFSIVDRPNHAPQSGSRMIASRSG